jgi:pimeloyl-ACP methyl ester carboxylesterase
MPRRKPAPATRPHPSRPRHTTGTAFDEAMRRLRAPTEPPATVSGRWLLGAVGIAVLGAAACAWGALCLLFWQGSWQLLYHPSADVARTPASVGLAFESVGFATDDAGQPRLRGWWIAADPASTRKSFTVLFLHGQTGNLGNAVERVQALHSAGVNVLAFDYRGFGQSSFSRPSEAHGLEDAGWALAYLEETRHVAPASILLCGEDLGANLALEVAAAHPELAGVVLLDPVEAPMAAVFGDARARLVPAHLLVRDRYDLDAAAAQVRVPSLWLQGSARGDSRLPGTAFKKLAVPGSHEPLASSPDQEHALARVIAHWLDGLRRQP